MFGGFQERALQTHELLGRPGTRFVVVAAAEGRRPARGRVLRGPVVGGVDAAGRVDPQPHAPESDVGHRFIGAGGSGSGDRRVDAGVLNIHADRAATAKRELHLLQRFTASHPAVPIVGVPACCSRWPTNALQAVAEQIVSRG